MTEKIEQALRRMEADRQTGRTTAMLRDALRQLRASVWPTNIAVVMYSPRDVRYAKEVLRRDLLATEREISEIIWTTESQQAKALAGRCASVYYDHAIDDMRLLKYAQARKKASR